VLTIAGNYIGNGGLVRVNTVFDGDASASGRLVVTGDTSGNGQIQTVKVGGSGAPTVEGIKVIDVQGASNANFTLLGDYSFRGDQAVVAGAYAYRLYKNGVSKPTDGDWYLRSTLIDTTPPGGTGGTGSATTEPAPLLAPTVPLYEAYSGVLQRFNELGTLQQRVGNRSWSPNASLQAEQEDGKPSIGRGAWAAEGSNTHVDSSTSTTGARYNVRNWKFEGGVDAPVVQTKPARWLWGRPSTMALAMPASCRCSVMARSIPPATVWRSSHLVRQQWFIRDGRTTVTWYDSASALRLWEPSWSTTTAASV
jgi:fibronectin-binding autotransporter adhesin